MKKLKIWLLEGPFTKYNEDVKQLAASSGLRIVDSRFSGDIEGEKKTPKVTVKGEKKRKKKASVEPDAQEVNQED